MELNVFLQKFIQGMCKLTSIWNKMGVICNKPSENIQFRNVFLVRSIFKGVNNFLIKFTLLKIRIWTNLNKYYSPGKLKKKILIQWLLPIKVLYIYSNRIHWKVFPRILRYSSFDSWWRVRSFDTFLITDECI